ncbi:MAG: hypothetical protein QMB22_02520 [Dehalococcoidia bacterium]|jgi:hypothetical protein|nr:MAG: hypothetical protein DK305_000383 [Chloroflexota bacterium]|tara:strand:+ start:198 stop:443 length:246 start_codon:yes stop_codon:yes gene_type:complete
MKQLTRIIKITFAFLYIFKMQIVIIGAEANNRSLVKANNYEEPLIYTLLAVVSLFIFFSLIYLFIKQLGIEWNFQKNDSEH